MKVEIYSDIACPWCYIGERRFARALAAFPGRDEVEVVFRPYQLDPTAPATARPLMDRLRQKFGPRVQAMLEHVSGAAHGEGIDIRWDDAVAANTLTAHRLLRLAEREYGIETQHALVNALFEAHFTKGGDIADPRLLTELAVAAGMGRERVERYLAADEGLREVREELATARQLGITAVPTFVFDGQYAVEGAQPTPTMLQVLEEVAARATAVPAGGATDDACADGSCAV